MMERTIYNPQQRKRLKVDYNTLDILEYINQYTTISKGDFKEYLKEFATDYSDELADRKYLTLNKRLGSLIITERQNTQPQSKFAILRRIKWVKTKDIDIRKYSFYPCRSFTKITLDKCLTENTLR